MRVVTKLARMEFTIGALAPDGDALVITSGGNEKALKVKAYVEAEDVIAFLRMAFRPAVIGYVFRLPLILRRRKRASAASPAAPASSSHPRTKREPS